MDQFLPLFMSKSGSGGEWERSPPAPYSNGPALQHRGGYIMAFSHKIRSIRVTWRYTTCKVSYSRICAMLYGLHGSTYVCSTSIHPVQDRKTGRQLILGKRQIPARSCPVLVCLSGPIFSYEHGSQQWQARAEFELTIFQLDSTTWLGS